MRTKKDEFAIDGEFYTFEMGDSSASKESLRQIIHVTSP